MQLSAKAVKQEIVWLGEIFAGSLVVCPYGVDSAFSTIIMVSMVNMNRP